MINSINVTLTKEAKSIGVKVVKPLENVIYNSVQKYRAKKSNICV